MSEENNKSNFNKYLDELDILYNNEPDRTFYEVKRLVLRLGDKEKKNVNFELENFDIYTICILGFLILLLGFFNVSELMLYIFGFVFFVVGVGIGLGVNKFGIIFLFSHGGTGIGIMVGSTLSKIIASPLMNDNPTNLLIYMVVALILFFIATLLVIVYNLSEKFRTKKHSILIPVSIYTLGFLMIQTLPLIINQIYNFNLF